MKTIEGHAKNNCKKLNNLDSIQPKKDFKKI